MEDKDYIHELVLKVFDDLKNSVDHYQVEFIGFGKCYDGKQMYITAFFRTEEERNDAFADGVTNDIDRKFLELAAPYDKKKILNADQKYIFYDSMENVQKNYEGKMPLYFAAE
jgi:hypothetical protein